MMLMRISGAFLIATVIAGPAMACDGNPVCTVQDPTGTPLNIRLGPNQKIVGNAPNGTKLAFIDHVEHKGKLWARVARFEISMEALDWGEGFLFGPYLDCEKPLTEGQYDLEILCKVDDPTGTPLNIRGSAGGEILGTVRNGETVRVYAAVAHKGKLWAQAWRDPHDNAVGWVFDEYLKCEEDAH